MTRLNVFGIVDAEMRVCFRHKGRLKFLDAATAPRAESDLAAENFKGMTCGAIDRPGTVILLQGGETAGDVSDIPPVAEETTGSHLVNNLPIGHHRLPKPARRSQRLLCAHRRDAQRHQVAGASKNRRLVPGQLQRAKGLGQRDLFGGEPRLRCPRRVKQGVLAAGDRARSSPSGSAGGDDGTGAGGNDNAGERGR